MFKGNRLLVAMSAFAVLAVPSHGQDFSKSMAKIFTGNQFKHYQWQTYPVSDYGVGTAYRGTSNQPTGGTFLCSTYACLSAQKSDPSTAEGLSKWLIVSADSNDTTGYAAAPCGGDLDAALQRNSKWAISALVPQLLGVLGLNANASNDKTAKTVLTGATACNRKLYQVKAIQYLTRTDHPDTYGVAAAYNNNRLVLVLEDVVIKSFDFQVTTTGDLKAGFDSKLNNDPTKKFGAGSDLQFNLEKTANDQYHLKSTTPLVVGFLAESNAKVPVGKGAAPGALGNWAGWQPTKVSILSK